MSKTVNMYIVRHGQTEYNVARKAQGWCDSPLTENGREIAAKLGKGLRNTHFDAAFVSSLGRAQDTIRIVLENAGKDIEPVVIDNLKERGLGPLEGQIVGRTAWSAAAEKATKDGYDGKVDIIELSRVYAEMAAGGEIEELTVFTNRLKAALDEIYEKSGEGSSNVLVVSHGMAILGMLYAITEDRYIYRFIDNASVTVVENKGGVYSIKSINDLSYIEGN